MPSGYGKQLDGWGDTGIGMVLDLGTWRADRSYLWSVFVHELSHAAIALGDRTTWMLAHQRVRCHPFAAAAPSGT
ncbi:MAG TPA: hypothetical protein VGR26_09800 [Acidimicrobiales bacterium]|nr:hypothetical protein [Acidimicrobiales bacterium]